MFNREKILLGITPTGWTNDDFPGLGEEIAFEQCVSEMALAGFQGCSVGHKFPTDSAELRAALELRGLRVSEPWASTFFTACEMEQKTLESFRRQMAFIKEMGGRDVVVAELGHSVHQRPVALIPNKPVFDDGRWRAMVEGLNRLGTLAQAEGMRLCYHHHMGTGVQTPHEIERLMRDTDPELVHLLLDTGHLFWAGGDPAQVVREHGPRIKHVHLKDIRRPVMEESIALGRSFFEAIEAGVFTVPGDGDIDFRPILQALAACGYEGWLVVEAEQDPKRAHPLTYAKKARAYLREVASL
jgi:inosose dehydratase